MDKVEIRNKKNRNRTKSRKDRWYKLCLQWGDNILEKSNFGEGFNESEGKELADLAPSRVLLIRKVKAKRQWILTK